MPCTQSLAYRATKKPVVIMQTAAGAVERFLQRSLAPEEFAAIRAIETCVAAFDGAKSRFYFAVVRVAEPRKHGTGTGICGRCFCGRVIVGSHCCAAAPRGR